MGIINLDFLTISPEMLKLIAEIDEFKGAFQTTGRLSPERLSSLKKVATIESIGSSTRIEGAQLSDLQVTALLSQLNTLHLDSRDEQEVAGYASACQQICENYAAIPLTENSIKQIHVWLLQYVNKDERHRGDYKKIPITIEAFDSKGKSIGVIFETVSPLETPFKMQELMSWINEAFEKKFLHPLIIIGLFVVIFLAIHPFQDGNGRLSRLLTTLLMLKSGYLYTPYSSLESVIEANKENYYTALQKTQKSWQNHHPDWSSWLLFFFRCLQRQKTHLEVKLAKEKILLNKIPPLNQEIIDLITHHGKLGINEIVVLTHGNRNTIKKALSSLIKENYLIRNGMGKASWYSLKIENV